MILILGGTFQTFGGSTCTTSQISNPVTGTMVCPNNFNQGQIGRVLTPDYPQLCGLFEISSPFLGADIYSCYNGEMGSENAEFVSFGGLRNIIS